MAGFMTKSISNVYEGELVNGAASAVKNGILMLQGTGADVDKMVLPAADSSSKFVCKEVGTIYDGMTAYRFVVDKLAKRYYFIDNQFDVNDSTVYDKREYEVDPERFVLGHPLVVGEEFWTTCVDGTIAAGTSYGVTADGFIG